MIFKQLHIQDIGTVQSKTINFSQRINLIGLQNAQLCGLVTDVLYWVCSGDWPSTMPEPQVPMEDRFGRIRPTLPEIRATLTHPGFLLDPASSATFFGRWMTAPAPSDNTSLDVSTGCWKAEQLIHNNVLMMGKLHRILYIDRRLSIPAVALSSAQAPESLRYLLDSTIERMKSSQKSRAGHSIPTITVLIDASEDTTPERLTSTGGLIDHLASHSSGVHCQVILAATSSTLESFRPRSFSTDRDCIISV